MNSRVAAFLTSIESSSAAKTTRIQIEEDALYKLQNTPEDLLAQIYSDYHQLRSQYKIGISKSIEVFKVIQQGLSTEAQEVREWLNPGTPAPDNVRSPVFVHQI